MYLEPYSTLPTLTLVDRCGGELIKATNLLFTHPVTGRISGKSTSQVSPFLI